MTDVIILLVAILMLLAVLVGLVIESRLWQRRCREEDKRAVQMLVGRMDLFDRRLGAVERCEHCPKGYGAPREAPCR